MTGSGLTASGRGGPALHHRLETALSLIRPDSHAHIGRDHAALPPAPVRRRPTERGLLV